MQKPSNTVVLIEDFSICMSHANLSFVREFLLKGAYISAVEYAIC